MTETAAPPITIRVPAKVNLFLQVGPSRSDGFHDLVTVFHAVSLYDEVTAAHADIFDLSVSGADAAAVPSDATNLAWQAAALLAERYGHRADKPRPLAASLHIDKKIPVAGGMAGGSADAAGALVACRSLWGLPVSDDELHGLAAELGSDVNFALIGGTAIGRGRGEELTPIDVSHDIDWVFATSDGGISAGTAYAELDRLRSIADLAQAPSSNTPSSNTPSSNTPSSNTMGLDILLGVLTEPDQAVYAAQIESLLRNDLQAAALSLMPSLYRVLGAGRDIGLTGIVSGSGPTCAFIAPSTEHAERSAAKLRDAGVCREAVTAIGPVPGPLTATA